MMDVRHSLSPRRRVLTLLTLLLVTSTSIPAMAAPDSGPEKKETVSEEQLLHAARQIDLKIAKLYKKKKLTVPADATDPVFLRRSFLLVAGRIPSVEEARTFLESDDTNKRQLLIRYLVNSPGYDSHMGNWLLDRLRIREQFENGRSSTPYMQWIRKAVRENLPYDELVRQLLSAEGAIWQNGAVGYYIRDKGMPLDNMAHTMRLFLGTRMECAQCHDHPFDEWERMDFYQLAAFTSGQSEINRGVWSSLWKEIRDAKEERSPLGRMVRFLGDEVYYPSLSGAGKGRIQLPGDYQYGDGDPGEWVGARTPHNKTFGKSTRMSKRRDSDDGLERFSTWVTHPDNERFATIITNRMWNRIIGTPLFDPVDEYVPPEDTSSPELTRYLVDLMQELHFDLKAFQHVLLLTRVYALESVNHKPAPGEKPLFNGRTMKRMNAEQYWDSLVTLIAGNPDKLPLRNESDAIYYGGRPVLIGSLSMPELQQEVLALESPAKLRRYAQQLLQRIDDQKNDQSAPSMMKKRRGGRGALSGIARASELPSPAPKGHVLQIFGQSDRILLDSASIEANATQVLAMLNGEVERLVVANDQAHIHSQSRGSARDRIRSLFFGTLSRPPRLAEMKLMEKEMATRGDAGFRNILSALINTREFIFIP
ncbi:DUF1549 domain-containing protein [Verrucomicrobiaceae bacterium N1E253]|uniref:DUF1549 domain-containing protein n=1 Tax=Oceaniferula marina TaxID=2748318 RepID=A0A851GIJ9_9BACT|nr:DUF1549 domain-containing protein [Oceaniferula marina]NWK55701.1 DUF1549 domain-containing protein [Oceaniferula marina]